MNSQRDFLVDVFQQKFRDLNAQHFCMYDYRTQRFYFLNFERHEVLLNMILNVKVLKKYSFQKRMFQHQINKHGIVKATAFKEKSFPG